MSSTERIVKICPAGTRPVVVFRIHPGRIPESASQPFRRSRDYRSRVVDGIWKFGTSAETETIVSEQKDLRRTRADDEGKCWLRDR